MRRKHRFFCHLDRGHLEICVGIFAFHKTESATDPQWAYARGAQQPTMHQTDSNSKNCSTQNANTITIDNFRECQDRDNKFVPSRAVISKPGCTPTDMLNENQGRGRAQESEFLQHFAGISDIQPACLLSRLGLGCLGRFSLSSGKKAARVCCRNFMVKVHKENYHRSL